MSGLAGVVGDLVLVWLRRGYSALTCSLAQGCREPGDGSARGAVEGLGTLALEWLWSGYSTLTWFPAKGCRRPGVGAGSVRLWLPGNCCTGVVGAVHLLLTRSPVQGYRRPGVGAAQGRETSERRAPSSVCRKLLSGAGKGAGSRRSPGLLVWMEVFVWYLGVESKWRVGVGGAAPQRDLELCDGYRSVEPPPSRMRRQLP